MRERKQRIPASVGALAVVLLAACGAPSTTGSSAAHVTDGKTVTVPALWANSAGQSGLEYAQVTVGTIGEPGFGIDLTDQEAKGAGPQWLAASAAAAAVATIWSGVDPSVVDVGYQVTGPIDGPSAGGILAVGTLAAINDDALKPNVTMTGTIGPDGTIGPVGGIEKKLQAAAEAGFTTMLIPRLHAPGAANLQSLEKQGAALGIDVQPVSSLLEAYEAFTGVDLAGASCEPVVDPAVINGAASQPIARTASSAAVTAADIRRQADDVAQATADITASIVEDSAHPVSGLSRNQLAALPALLAPAIRANALAEAAAQWATAQAQDRAGLEAAAGMVAFAQASLAQAPRDVAAWRALPPDVAVDPQQAALTGAAYSTLLSTAATATTDYLQTVLGLQVADYDRQPLIAIPARAGMALDERATTLATAPVADLTQAALRASDALAAWTLGQQVHDLVSSKYGPADVERATRAAAGLATVAACRAQARGFDPSWPMWSIRTAVDAAARAPQSQRQSAWLAAEATVAAAQVSLSMLAGQGLDAARAATAN